MSLTFLLLWRFFGFIVPPLLDEACAVVMAVWVNGRMVLLVVWARIGERVEVGDGRRDERSGLKRRENADGRVAAMTPVVGGERGVVW